MREYGRPHEPTTFQSIGPPLAAGQEHRAFVYPEADIGLDPFPLLLAHHGADLHLGVCRGADLQGVDMVLQPYQRFIQPALGYEEARTCDASLPAVGEA